jgi:hypothetical protein
MIVITRDEYAGVILLLELYLGWMGKICSLIEGARNTYTIFMV